MVRISDRRLRQQAVLHPPGESVLWSDGSQIQRQLILTAAGVTGDNSALPVTWQHYIDRTDGGSQQGLAPGGVDNEFFTVDGAQPDTLTIKQLGFYLIVLTLTNVAVGTGSNVFTDFDPNEPNRDVLNPLIADPGAQVWVPAAAVSPNGQWTGVGVVSVADRQLQVTAGALNGTVTADPILTVTKLS